jgi:hypothetical protein
LFVALMIYGALRSGVKPVSAEPFVLVLGLLMLFPISSDPLDKIPAVRLALWPLRQLDRALLRIASLGFSSVLWLTLLLLLWWGAWTLAMALAGVAAVVQAVRVPHWRGKRLAPRIPGRLGGLIGVQLRGSLSVLDFYLALALSIGGTAWRIADAHADPAAFPILAMLVALALSTGAQCPFGLDSDSAMTRYRLLPLRGWQILLAKDAAYLAVLLVLVAPLSWKAGLAFGVAALAVGRYPALKFGLTARRWRFTSGRVLYGTIQGIAGFALGFTTRDYGLAPLGVAAAMYLVSLYLGGRAWDRMRLC